MLHPKKLFHLNNGALEHTPDQNCELCDRERARRIREGEAYRDVPTPIYYSVKDAARILSVDETSIRRWFRQRNRDGVISTKTARGRIHIQLSRAAMDTFIAEHARWVDFEKEK